jgi:hypothetical protein
MMIGNIIADQTVQIVPVEDYCAVENPAAAASGIGCRLSITAAKKS